MTITFTSGSREGERISFDLKNPVLIGRSRSAQIRLSELDVAGRHAEITKSNGGVLVTCRSSHGLQVNGDLVNTDESRPLSVGDEIAMGVCVRFKVDDMDEEKRAIDADALTTIKLLMGEGETVQADAALKELLVAEPDNLQAKMLYGICRQLLGDEETFRRIHDELAPVMKRLHENNTPKGDISTWNKYHKIFSEQTSDGLVTESDSEEPYTFDLYGCFDYDSKKTMPMSLYRSPGEEELVAFRKMIEDKRRRKRIVCLLLIAAPFFFWLVWWLGQRF